jgi:hypothetical protein
MTANETLFCLRTDLTHPFTWIDEGGPIGDERSWRMVGGKVDVEEKRRNMLGAKFHKSNLK